MFKSHPDTADARDELLRVRLSAAELALIDGRAARVGLPRSAYVREALLAEREDSQ